MQAHKDFLFINVQSINSLSSFGLHKTSEDVNSYTTSIFFFVDRFASYKTDCGEFYNNGGTVICDRYTTSNAIHQDAKMTRDELPKFLVYFMILNSV